MLFFFIFSELGFSQRDTSMFYSVIFTPKDYQNWEIYLSTSHGGKYPNPFSPNTPRVFSIKKLMNWAIEIRDRKVDTLVDYIPASKFFPRDSLLNDKRFNKEYLSIVERYGSYFYYYDRKDSLDRLYFLDFKISEIPKFNK